MSGLNVCSLAVNGAVSPSVAVLAHFERLSIIYRAFMPALQRGVQRAEEGQQSVIAQH